MTNHYQSSLDKWVGKQLREKKTGRIGVVVGIRDYGGWNQRIEIILDRSACSVQVPGFLEHYLVDYEIIYSDNHKEGDRS